MISDLETTTYNTSKKLSQLNKVIQYLSFHLEERIYQVLYVKNKYEAQEQEIINGIDDKIRPIFEGLNESRIEIEEQVKKFYQNKLSTMKAALDVRSKEAFEGIQSKMREIETEIGNSFSTIEIINSTLEEQISILKGKSKTDPSITRAQVVKIEKDSEFELKKLDGETKRKIKSLEDEFQKKEKELETEHLIRKEQIRAEVIRENPTFPISLKKPLLNMKERAKQIKDFVLAQKNEINKTAHIFQQSIATYRQRLKNLMINFPKEIDINTAEDIQEMKKDNEQRITKMNNRIEELRNEFNFIRTNYETELTQLQLKLKTERGNLDSNKEAKEIEFQLSARKSNNELFSFLQTLNGQKCKLRIANEKKLKEIEENIKKIQWNIEHFDEESEKDFASLHELRESHLLEFAQEKNRFRNDYENIIAFEIKKFNELKQRLDEEVKNFSEKSMEFSKKDEEYKKLKINLETMKRSDEIVMNNLNKSVENDLEKVRDENQKEFEKLEYQLNSIFDCDAHKKKADIADYQNTLDNEFRKKYLEMENANNIILDQIRNEIFDESQQTINETNSEFEKKFNLIESELNSIDDTSELMELTDESIQKLQEKLKKLPNDVIEERNSINKKYEKSLDEEEERHRQSLLSYLAYCNETNERDYESFQKEQKERIANLDKTIIKLNDELKSIEDLAPLLKKSDDLTDIEVSNLEEELLKIRLEMKLKIKNQENAKYDAIKEIKVKIAKQNEESQKEIKDEKEKEKIEYDESHKLYDVQRRKRKYLCENFIQILNGEQKNFNDLLAQTKNDFNNNIVEIKRAIINERLKLEDENESFEVRFRRDKKRLENEKRAIFEKLPEQLMGYKEGAGKMYPELDTKIKEMTKRRDDAKYAILNKPMRKEEMSVIKKLEGQLTVTTNQLTMLGKELIQYRQQLILQEGEYNVRFGVDRSVAVMKPAKRRPTTTMATKRLPKLCNSDCMNNLY